jgi:FkbM family methyltransferase
MLHKYIDRISRSPRARSVLIPLLRSYFRYFPIAKGKEALWIHWAEPYFAWHSYEYVARTRFGKRLSGNTRDMVQQYIYYFGLWEAEMTWWLGGQLRRGDTFVDVGANIGYYALLGSALVGPQGQVVAVEASPSIARTLQENVRLNGGSNVRIVNCAASDRPGKLEFFRGPEHNSGQSSMLQHEGSQAEGAVDALPLSDILRREELEQCRVIKIDVEGAEWAVLQGLAPHLKRCRRELQLLVEIHPQYLGEQGIRPGAIIELLANHGYQATVLPNSYWPFAWRRTTQPPKPFPVNSAIAEETVLVFSRA